MAGYDVVIAGFRLNAQEQPAKTLERILLMSAEEARVCSKRFPHVALSNAPREAAEALRARLDEAGARVSITPHEPGAVIANDIEKAQVSSLPKAKEARSVSLAAIEPLDIQENARSSNSLPAKPRTSAPSVSRPPAVPHRPPSDGSGASHGAGYALGELALSTTPAVVASKPPAAPKPSAAPKPAAKPALTVKNDFDMEEDYAAGSGLDLDMGGPAVPSYAPPKRSGSPPAKARAPAAPAQDFSIGGGGRDLDDTFAPEGQDAKASLELALPQGNAAGGKGLHGGVMPSRNNRVASKGPLKRTVAVAPPPPRRLLWLCIAIAAVASVAGLLFLTPWFRPPAEQPSLASKPPADGALAIGVEEPVAASFSLSRSMKEGVIAPAHKMLLEVRAKDGPVFVSLEGRFADRTGRWVEHDGDAKSLRGVELPLTALASHDHPENSAFVAWSSKSESVSIEKATLLLEDVSARDMDYAPSVYTVTARFALELSDGQKREATYTGPMTVREPN